ncbi:Holliday junction resolvase RuvX [Patescibacteria group bacterium]
MSRYIAIDYGEKRLGVAATDESKQQAFVRPVINVKDDNDSIQALIKLVKEEKAELIVIGLPIGLNGQETEQTIRVKDFTKLLALQIDVPIEFWDERLSTVAARKITPDKSKENIDSQAAKILLDDYIDFRRING